MLQSQIIIELSDAPVAKKFLLFLLNAVMRPECPDSGKGCFLKNARSQNLNDLSHDALIKISLLLDIAILEQTSLCPSIIHSLFFLFKSHIVISFF